jgi:hypothetical protein
MRPHASSASSVPPALLVAAAAGIHATAAATAAAAFIHAPFNRGQRIQVSFRRQIFPVRQLLDLFKSCSVRGSVRTRNTRPVQNQPRLHPTQRNIVRTSFAHAILSCTTAISLMVWVCTRCLIPSYLKVSSPTRRDPATTENESIIVSCTGCTATCLRRRLPLNRWLWLILLSTGLWLILLIGASTGVCYDAPTAADSASAAAARLAG